MNLKRFHKQPFQDSTTQNSAMDIHFIAVMISYVTNCEAQGLNLVNSLISYNCFHISLPYLCANSSIYGYAYLPMLIQEHDPIWLLFFVFNMFNLFRIFENEPNATIFKSGLLRCVFFFFAFYLFIYFTLFYFPLPLQCSHQSFLE